MAVHSNVSPASPKMSPIRCFHETVRGSPTLSFTWIRIYGSWTSRPEIGSQFVVSTQYDSSPAFSPDGTESHSDRTARGTNEIWVAEPANPATCHPADTTGRTTTTGSPQWSPDGSAIAFDARPDGSPISTSLSFLRRTETYYGGSAGGCDCRPGRIDGRGCICFQPERITSDLESALGRRNSSQITKQGGLRSDESTDGKYVYYAKGRTVSGLWRVPTDGGNEEPVLSRLKPGYWGYWTTVGEAVYFVDKECPANPCRLCTI